MRGGTPQNKNNRIRKGGVSMDEYLSFKELEFKLQALKSVIRVDIPNIEQRICQLKEESDPEIAYAISTPRIKSEEEAKYNKSPNPYTEDRALMMIEYRTNLLNELSFFEELLTEKPSYGSWGENQMRIGLDEKEVEIVLQRYIYDTSYDNIACRYGYCDRGSARRSIERMLTSRVKILRFEVLRLRY